MSDQNNTANEESTTDPLADLPIWYSLIRLPPLVLLRAFNWWEDISKTRGSYPDSVDLSEDLTTTTKIRIIFPQVFYIRVLWWIIVGIALFSGLVIVVRFKNKSVDYQSVGLMMDIWGSIILASGLIRGGEGVARDTVPAARGALLGGRSRYSRGALASTISDTIDGLLGVVILVIGFLLQLTAVAF